MASETCVQSSEAVGKLVKAANTFAFDLYGKVCEEAGEGKNVFMSPISLTTALSLVLAGAKSLTADEIKQTLQFTDFADQELHSAFEDFQSTLDGSKEKVNYILKAANRLFLHKGYNILQEYKDITQKHYGAEAETCDFVTAAAASKDTINQWVEAQTANKIKDLIPDGFINELTRLILVNAIYFKGNWKDKFKPEATKKSKFYINDKDTVEVDMMFKDDKYKIGHDRELGVQVVEIPYVDEHLSMVIFLPQKRTGLAELEAKLTTDKMQELISKTKKTKIMLHLPRFKLEHKFSAKDMLSSMGMKAVFTDAADLSGISGTRDLHVSQVIHKAYLEVNEEGSEAAAATGVGIAMMCMPPRVNADHPFLFSIRDNRSAAILFMGKVMNPVA